jgi:hypothetical protein
MDICDSHFLDENGKLVKDLRYAIFLEEKCHALRFSGPFMEEDSR